MLVFSILDLCGACYNQLSMQFAASRVMRVASINSGMDYAQVRAEVSGSLGMLGVRLSPNDHVTLCPVDKYLGTECPENTVLIGDQRELMVLHVRKAYGTIVNNFLPRTLSLEALVLGRNEPV